ncbi:MAG: cyclase family protein [Gammaproteobacteria bacterium]|nr:cyclase family protein [Gammaproteobacteria bacterium]
MVVKSRASATILAVIMVSCAPSDDANVPGGRAQHEAVISAAANLIPRPPWSHGDERGMANAIGAGTWLRCAHHLTQSDAKVYELSHVRSNDMPQSPWSPPLTFKWRATAGVPGYLDAWHPGELVNGEPGAQGTQMDAFGHWGALSEPWDGEAEFPVDTVTYYGGFTQSAVKPTPESPLLKLGIDKVPPIVTSAVLLDARSYLGDGEPLPAGTKIEPEHLNTMLERQGLSWRGILPGDVVYVYTGWSDYWNDDIYYQGGPGLSYESALYLEERGIVLVALDNPFTDAVNIGQFTGGPKTEGPPEIYTPVHYHNLSQAGIHNIQNANLRTMVDDQVWLSCTIILPLLVEGGTGSPVRPIAIGAP